MFYVTKMKMFFLIQKTHVWNYLSVFIAFYHACWCLICLAKIESMKLGGKDCYAWTSAWKEKMYNHFWPHTIEYYPKDFFSFFNVEKNMLFINFMQLPSFA
jgi:hypothetical protein